MKDFFFRYQRQLILEGFGITAQKKLSGASVLVIGAGGLGCPVLQYLAASGIGTLGLVDADVVDMTNLNRQIFYGKEDVGHFKVDRAAEKIKTLNDLIHVRPYQQKCDQPFAIAEFPGYDVIVDATDNFASRYLINDACVLLNKPLVFGAVSKFEGQIAVFNVLNRITDVHYRDLFPHPPKNGEVMNCAEGGVLGVLPGVIGVLQAMEVIKLITAIGDTLTSQLMMYNGLTSSFYKMQLVKNPLAETVTPASLEEFEQTNYEYLCS